MPTEIDSLSISIEAKAQKANSSIDKLVSRLDVLSKSLGKLNGGSANLVGVANGVDRLGKAMQTMNAVKTADFTRLATNLAKLGTINVSALNSTASSLSHLTRAFNTLGAVSTNAQQVGTLAQNLSRLGSASMQRAITNIPQLATAMNKLMTTLSKAPRVSQNVIQMTNALANLSAQGSKVGSASASIERGINRASNSATRATKSFGGLASAIGKFYATYFLAIRGLKGLWKSINMTADYVEAFNYFTVSMGKIASKWDKDWENYGDENARNYSNKFFTTLNKTFGKLSGVSYDPQTGLLSETGLKNLGLNLQEVTQYAAQLGSMMDAVGQSGETTLATTNAFVKLAGDISSLYNIDYQDAANKIRSVLQGQSRAGYGFGWDTTMASLQATADSLDLSKAVSEMSQMEKQQLRILTILNQSRVAWGDQSNTINTLANQIRIFKNNFSEAAMMLGQLFVPILSKMMPIINGVTIAIKNLLGSIASLLGLNLGDTGQGFGALEDDAEDTEDAINGVTGAVKKLKGQLLGIDELNVLNSGDNGSGGGGGVGGGIDLTDEILQATSEYERVWQEAFDKMKNRAQEFADKIAEFFSPVTDKIKKLFQDIKIGDWFAVGRDVSGIATSLFDLLSQAIDNVDWKKIGENIGEFLNGIDWNSIFESMWKFLKTVWNSLGDFLVGLTGKNPLATISLIFGLIVNAISTVLPLISTFIGYISKIISFIPKIKDFVFAVSGLITSFVGTPSFDVLGANLWDFFSNLMYTIFPDELVDSLSSIGGGAIIGALVGAIFDGPLPFGELVGALIGGVIGALTLKDENGQNLWEIIFGRLFNYNAAIEMWDTAIESFKTAFDGNRRDWFDMGSFIVEGIIEGLLAVLVGIFEPAADLFEWIYDGICSVFGIHSPAEQMKPLGENIFLGILEGFTSDFSAFNDAISKFFEENIEPWFTKEKWENILSEIPTTFESIFKKAANGAIGFLNDIIEGIETMINGALESLSSLEFLSKIGIDLGSFDKVSLPRIPAYRNGGFPEDGLFYANRGELVGQFSNGKTAVANNEMIVNGIEGGVERAVSRVLAPYLADIADSSRRTANKEFGITRRQAFNAVREEAMIFRKSTGAPAF